MNNLVAAPALMVTLLEVMAVPDCGVKVNVPVPTVPVNTKLDVKLATPLVKLPA
ncbi:hypothetical protein AQBE111736_13845 [Aquirufa beregesia]